MADLDPLIRYRRHGVDEKRRFLAQLYREQEKMTQQKQVLEQQMAKETALAQELGTPEALGSLGRYLEVVRRKIRALEDSIKKMDARIAAAQEDVRAAFAEVKKIEITQENREEREEAERARKETNELDDIAIDQFRRQTEE